MTTKKRGLAKGRGLDALLGSIQKEKLQLEAQALDHGQLKQIDVHLLQRGEYQPRRFIHEQDLQHEELLACYPYKWAQLVKSIIEQGV